VSVARCCQIGCNHAAIHRITWNQPGRGYDWTDACEEHVDTLLPETGDYWIDEIDVSVVDLLGFIAEDDG